MTSTPHAPALEGLFYTLQQLHEVSPAEGLAIAFTSANPGEGVTHTLQALVSGLPRDAATRTLLAGSRTLRELTCPPAELATLCRPIGDSLFELTAAPAPRGPHSWEGSWQYRRDCLLELRRLFPYVLLDCPSLREANDVLSLAPFVSGVILVVAAGQTRRDQVLHAEKAITFARGNLLGHILNKRTYAVPHWLYKRL